MTAGKTYLVLTLHASRTSLSESKDMTLAPTIGEHDLRVITFRTTGFCSPCTVTRFAIWEQDQLAILSTPDSS
jgi:hypothetical protein